MSTPILKSYVDERGNISVQVSRDVQMLTREEADCIEAEYKRMQAENDKLREQGARLFDKTLELGTENAKLRKLISGAYEAMDAWQMVIANGSDTWGYGKGCLEQLRKLRDDMRELGIEVE